MFNKTLVTYLGLFLVAGAFGDIVVWTNNANDCTIDDTENTIQINAAGTYGFRAWNGDPGNRCWRTSAT
jgi:hypothetical protein